MAASSSDRPRTFLGPRFVVAGLLLLAAAFGLRPAIAAVAQLYGKRPIALRKTLDDLDASRLATFRPVTATPNLGLAPGDVETEDVIATVFEPRTAGSADPREQVMLFVTYYSDPRERIAHTPEVCYRQSGAVVQSIETITVDTPGLGPDQPQVQARLLDIDSYGYRSVVAYVLVTNGEFFHDREATRFAIGWPGDRYIYFSKVEAVTRCSNAAGFDAAVERVRTLLSEALPILVSDHYPTVEQVRDRTDADPG